MTCLDDLCLIPNRITGRVLSVSPNDQGYSFVAIDETGIDLGNRRRWLGYQSDVDGQDRLRPGDQIRFLPGPPRGRNKMGRAYSVQKLSKESGEPK